MNPQLTSDSNGPKTSKSDTSTANLGFEGKLWVEADTLRNIMDAEAYLGPAPADTFLRGDKLFALGDPPSATPTRPVCST